MTPMLRTLLLPLLALLLPCMALAQKNDAYACAVEQDLLFAQSALQGGVRGSGSRTLQLWSTVGRGHGNQWERQRGPTGLDNL